MITFYLAAAALLLLASAFLLPAFFRRSRLPVNDSRRAQNIAIAREQLADLKRQHAEGELDDVSYEQARENLETQLADDLSADEQSAPEQQDRGRWAGVAVAVALPLLAGFLYLTLGNPRAIGIAPHPVAQQGNPQQQQAAGQQQKQNLPSVDEMIAQLEARMETNPEDPQGWFMLARSYMVQQRYDDAVKATRKLRELVGDEPVVLVRLADALAMQAGGKLAGEPTKLLEQALEAQPDNVQGLWLMAMSQAEQGQPRDAIATWQKVLPLISDDQKSTEQVQEMIAQTERQLGIEPGSADSVLPTQAAASASAAQPAAAAKPAAGGKAAVTVEVSLDPALAASAAPGDAVFIYAKATSGPPMPLAAVRKKVADLPLTITLDDSMAMMPAMRLSAFPQVTVGARVSKSGNAISQPGDLIGEVSPVASKGADPVSISIASRVP
jgi:cytochrome c-type biogenesis protein CcmH